MGKLSDKVRAGIERRITPAKVKRSIGPEFNQRLFDWQINSMDRRDMPYSDSKEWLTVDNTKVGDRVVVKAGKHWYPATVLGSRSVNGIRIQLDDGDWAFWTGLDGSCVARHLPFMEDPLDPSEIQNMRECAVEYHKVIRDLLPVEATDAEIQERAASANYGEDVDPALRLALSKHPDARTPEEESVIVADQQAELDAFDRWESHNREFANPDLEPYLVAWPLADGRIFRMPVLAVNREDAAEQFFNVANGMSEGPDAERWAEMKHRSLSVGDQIVVDGEFMYCDDIGWRVAVEHDTVSHGQMLVQAAFPDGNVHTFGPNDLHRLQGGEASAVRFFPGGHGI